MNISEKNKFKKDKDGNDTHSIYTVCGLFYYFFFLFKCWQYKSSLKTMKTRVLRTHSEWGLEASTTVNWVIIELYELNFGLRRWNLSKINVHNTVRQTFTGSLKLKCTKLLWLKNRGVCRDLFLRRKIMYRL